VARDVTSRVGEPDHMQMYLLASQATIGAPFFVRPRSDSPAALAEIVRAAESAGYTVQFSRRLSTYLDDAMLPFFGLAVLSGALGALALAMASVGLYGVMAFAVNQRVREIGIRVALGATAAGVVRLFVRQGMRLVAIGIGLGLAGGALFALLIGKILYGLGGAFDPLAFGAVTLIFAAIASCACWLPARRAAKVDPMVALRAE
jgi:putative ABC transport system permease protein